MKHEVRKIKEKINCKSAKTSITLKIPDKKNLKKIRL